MTNLTLVRDAMERLGVTAGELAKTTGIHSGLIGRYLRGETTIGMKNAPRLATALGLTPADVLFGCAADGESDEAA